jgi:hypothetical protein
MGIVFDTLPRFVFSYEVSSLLAGAKLSALAAGVIGLLLA